MSSYYCLKWPEHKSLMVLDIIFLVFVISGFVNGFRRGLVRSILGFVGLFFGILIAIKYSYTLSSYIYDATPLESRFIPLVSFVIIFIGVMIVVHLISKIIEKVADTLLLGTFNKIIGGVLGITIMILLFSTILWYIDKLDLLSLSLKATSKTYPYLISLSPIVIDLLSKMIPYFHGIFDAIENLIDKAPNSSANGGTLV